MASTLPTADAYGPVGGRGGSGECIVDSIKGSIFEFECESPSGLTNGYLTRRVVGFGDEIHRGRIYSELKIIIIENDRTTTRLIKVGSATRRASAARWSFDIVKTSRN